MPFVAHNPAAKAHDQTGHAETAARQEAILRAFAADPVVSKWRRIVPDRLLTKEEAKRVHTDRLWLNLELADRDPPTLLDPDTYLVAGSFEAARGTARLGLQAVEADDSGFVVARPPGHHATADRSMGFCLLNNVALAAQHALDRGAKRVLVFDHDAHHGNGTQEIFYGRADVLYQSFHLSPHYPGSGRVEEIGSGEGNGFTVNAPLPFGAGDREVRDVLLNVFLPIARAYRPDLVLLSAGFDSLSGDPLGGLSLSAQFTGEIARRFRHVCPRIVAVLEGGYQLDKIPEAAVAMARGLVGNSSTEPQEVAATRATTELRRLLRDAWPTLA